MRKDRVFDLGLNLQRKEIKSLFKKIVGCLENQNSYKICEYDLVYGGSNLLEFRDKHTDMNLFHYACSSIHKSGLLLLRKIRKLKGSKYIVKKCLKETNKNSGRNCLHYIAFSKNYLALQYLAKKATDDVIQAAMMILEGKTGWNVIETCFTQPAQDQRAALRTALILVSLSKFHTDYTPRQLEILFSVAS